MTASGKVFPEVPSDLNFPKDEEAILTLWREKDIFQRTIAARQNSEKGTFVFYEGPPTANGMPHNGHVLTRVMKDLLPRYKTMRGYEVPRKAGWDTHGLPVEVEVEKELRIHGKEAIVAYGIEPFTAKCIDSVFRYTNEWARITERIGFWVDTDDAYVTYHRDYVESVWWSLAELQKRGLLYRGHRVCWWWAQGGTALSSGEVGQGYKTITDPSAYVAFPLVGVEGGRALVVWTTTPWTLSSNAYAAVHPDIDYAYATIGNRKVIVAEALAGALAEKVAEPLTIEKTVKGAALVGLEYEPPFDLYSKNLRGKTPYWKVIAADFVALGTGTGIVHIAPAFGEDDYEVHNKLTKGMNVPLLCAVKPDGTFIDEFQPYAGRWVKSADRDIAKDLDARGLLVKLEDYRHDYPFCWRADEDPLIQYARPAWYIRTTSKIDDAIANNRAIDWHPETIKEGRFGDFLQNNVDWALSRERFWGTPLPIWENESVAEDHPDRYIAIESLADLRRQPDVNLAAVEQELAAAIPDKERAHHLLVHKPWIDKVTFTKPGVFGSYKRVPEVIDAWYDSGSMPFAQWGFPHAEGSHEKFKKAFPADFISEAIDQTRGWFYSLLMISTLVFDEATQKRFGVGPISYPHPYKACIVLGHVSDKEGKKESKSKGNYTPPEIILDSVSMQFAVVAGDALFEKSKVAPADREGKAFIAREDLEGMDLAAGAVIRVAKSGSDAFEELAIEPLKGLPRRVIALPQKTRDALGLVFATKADVKPVEVPGLPANERATVLDPTTPAPGADAFRWFFYASNPPWNATRHSLSNVRALQKDFVVKLRNVVSFFSIYANVDGWKPGTKARAAKDRPLLCRWILSELARLVRDVTTHLDHYEIYESAQKLAGFVDALSNWYVRRSRERFWAPGAGDAMSDDKRDAYATLYTCLVTLSKLIAPFVPFYAERMHQDLVVAAGAAGAQPSVHLEDYPVSDSALVDENLSHAMEAVRELVSLGLAVRAAAKLKVRQPLAQADLVLSKASLSDAVRPLIGLVVDELNVHKVDILAAGTETKAVRYRLKPNFRTLGAKLGKRVQLVKALLEKSDPSVLRAALAEHGKVTLDLEGEPLELTAEDLDIAVEAETGFAASGGRTGVVILHTTLDAALLDEGHARELQSRLSAMRKELGLGFTDRVRVAVGGSERSQRVARANAAAMSEALLATTFAIGKPSFTPEANIEANIDGETVELSMAKALATLEPRASIPRLGRGHRHGGARRQRPG